jgi:hypothetical protein
MKSAIIIASLGLASVLSFGANAAVNKPSSSYPTTCPRSVGGFFMAAAH